jgi:hypothetical protein
MKKYHDPLAFLNSIGNQLSQFKENFSNLEVFKDELTVILNKVIDGHNSLKQELFLIRNHLNVTNGPGSPDASSPACPSSASSNPATSTPSSKPSRAPAPAKAPAQAVKGLTPSSEPKILFIGDSIRRSLNIPIISKATKSKVKLVKAYSSKYDDISNIAKQAAKYRLCFMANL